MTAQNTPASGLRATLSACFDEVLLEPQDMAAVELALILADEIDRCRAQGLAGRTIAELSSKLTTLMVELQLTPKSRKAVKEIVKEVQHVDPDERLLFELQN